MAVTVLLVDDNDELRAVLRQALRLRGGFEVVADTADGTAAIAAARRHQPDIVVLDLALPDLAGRAVLGGLREAAPATQVVIYSGSHTPDRMEVARAAEVFVDKGRDVRYVVDLLSDLSRGRLRTAAVELGPSVQDVAMARDFVAAACERWGYGTIAPEAQLVASELVTNALVHAGTGCQLRLRVSDVMLRLEVTDHGGGSPDLEAAGALDEGGRGLFLVSILSSAWGADSLSGGAKTVWAELALAEARARSSVPGGGETANPSRPTLRGPSASRGRSVGGAGPGSPRDEQGRQLLVG